MKTFVNIVHVESIECHGLEMSIMDIKLNISCASSIIKSTFEEEKN